MKLIKKQNKDTYKKKDGTECHYYNYYLIDDNGHSVQIKPAFSKRDDFIRLDCMSIYEK